MVAGELNDAMATGELDSVICPGVDAELIECPTAVDPVGPQAAPLVLVAKTEHFEPTGALRRKSRIWPGNRALRPQGRIVPSKPIVSNHLCGIICGNIRAMVPIPADYSLNTRGDYTPTPSSESTIHCQTHGNIELQYPKKDLAGHIPLRL